MERHFNLGTRGFDSGCHRGIAGRGAFHLVNKKAKKVTGEKELALAA